MHHLARVVAKAVEDRGVAVARELLAACADLFICPQVFNRHRVVGLVAERAQNRATEGVVGDAATHIRVAREELDNRACFGLAQWIRPRALLLAFGCP